MNCSREDLHLHPPIKLPVIGPLQILWTLLSSRLIFIFWSLSQYFFLHILLIKNIKFIYNLNKAEIKTVDDCLQICSRCYWLTTYFIANETPWWPIAVNVSHSNEAKSGYLVYLWYKCAWQDMYMVLNPMKGSINNISTLSADLSTFNFNLSILMTEHPRTWC